MKRSQKDELEKEDALDSSIGRTTIPLTKRTKITSFIMDQNCPFMNLPPEMIVSISEFCSIEQIRALRLVSKQLKELVDERNSQWDLFKKFLRLLAEDVQHLEN